ncbi:ATP-binding cassette sub-family B member 9 [Trichoplax sp. H2]|nr:ATP-binding cassette sub-family B member 9 [Trichoplax sp. H2]|eukprot:RDD46555.1 ATP-binding cassette sub-family B member 9 [Trichoplax sp. H2]
MYCHIMSWCKANRTIITYWVAIWMALFDISITTVVTIAANNGSLCSPHLKSYQIDQSVCDLWVLSLIRFIFAIACVGAILRYKRAAIDRIKIIKKFKWFIITLVLAFLIAKAISRRHHSRITAYNWFEIFIGITVLFTLSWLLITFLLCGLSISSILSDDGITITRIPLLDSSRTTLKSNFKTIFQLLHLCLDDKYYILIGFIFFLITAGIDIAVPYVDALTFQVIFNVGAARTKLYLIRNLGILLACRTLCVTIRDYLLNVQIARMIKRIRQKLFEVILKQETGYFDTVDSGELTSRLISDVKILSSDMTLSINLLLSSIIRSVGMAVFMYVLSYKLALLTFIYMPLVAVVVDYFQSKFKVLSKRKQDAIANANSVANEVIPFIKVVRSYANEKGEILHYNDKVTEVYGYSLKLARVFAGFFALTDSLRITLKIITLYYGSYLTHHEAIDSTTIFAFIVFQPILQGAIQEVGTIYADLLGAIGVADRVMKLFTRIPEKCEYGDEKPSDFKGYIQFNNVSFAYPNKPDTMAIENLSFSVKPGEIVALVGANGSGKSTTIKLCKRLYEPKSGEILLDSRPLSDYDNQYLHSKVAMVEQDPTLFSRLISENISYGYKDCKDCKDRKDRKDCGDCEDCKDYKEGKVIDAAVMANADEFISKLENRYASQVEERGQNLSGGQKQRISIARALVRDPKVLLLDEATNSLDPTSERLVQEAIKKTFKDRTVIVIAHTTNTFKRVDRILFLENGKIVEEGNHEELLEKNGRYANFIQK